MQGLDRQRHAGRTRILEQFSDTVGNLGARARDVFVRRPAGQGAGQAAHHQHQAGRTEFSRLVDSAPVVVAHCLAAGRIDGRKHAAPAVAGKRQAMVPNQLRHGCQSGRRHLVAPGRDRTDATAGAGVDDLGQRQLDAPGFSNRCGVDRQPAVVAREVAHYSTPCRASKVFIRLTASSGCSSRLAASASRNSSARCGSERVLC